jgi:CHAD domain-containing protein
MQEDTISQTHTFANWAYAAIEKHLEKTLKYEEDVLEDRDPESLHQMRVGMRRLRSCVTGFAAALDLPSAAQDKNIGKVARCLGELRDLDVILEALENQYKPSLPAKEQKVLDKAIKSLKKDRKKVLDNVQDTLKSKTYKQLKDSLKEWLKEPAYHELAQMPVQEILPDLLLPTICRLFLHPGWLVGVKIEDSEIHLSPVLKLDSVEAELEEHGKILHSLRKQTKRVRYNMALFTDLYPESYAEYVKDMKAIQEILGNIQDSIVLAEVLQETLKEKVEKVLPAFTEQLVQTRYQAWQDWQPLQKQYLNPETRLDFRQEILHPLLIPTEDQA